MSEHDESSSGTERPGNSGGSGEASGSPHAPVSSDGDGEGVAAGEAVVTVDQVAESFDGQPEVGELESLPGFDPQRAFAEGMPPEIITDELLNGSLLK
jgi:hypothetical protein